MVVATSRGQLLQGLRDQDKGITIKAMSKFRSERAKSYLFKSSETVLAAVQEEMGSQRDGLWEPEDLLGSHCDHAGRDRDA